MQNVETLRAQAYTNTNQNRQSNVQNKSIQERQEIERRLLAEREVLRKRMRRNVPFAATQTQSTSYRRNSRDNSFTRVTQEIGERVSDLAQQRSQQPLQTARVNTDNSHRDKNRQARNMEESPPFIPH